MSRIVISYRRDDSEGWVRGLYDQLSNHFGEDQVFRDLDTLQPGDDFERDIEKAIGTADVVLVVIARNWVTIKDPLGNRRLDDPTDLHRREVATALRLPVRVIPVLMQDAPMPRSAELPEDLVDLTRRHSYSVSDARWRSDMGTLITFLEQCFLANQSAAVGSANPRTEAGPAVHASFLAPHLDLMDLAVKLARWIESQDFDVQILSAADDAHVVQARRAGGLRNALGMAAALSIVLRNDGDLLEVDIQSGRWLDRASTNRRNVLASLDSLPFLAPKAWAGWQQEGLQSRIMDEIRRYIGQAQAGRPRTDTMKPSASRFSRGVQPMPRPDARVPLLERMQREAREIDRAIGCTPKLNRDADGFIVSVRYTDSRGRLVELFITCSPDYPTIAPAAFLAIDGQERRFHSPTLQTWARTSSLAKVASEIVSSA